MMEMEKLKKQVEEKIKNITEQGVQGSNLEVLGKLVDIHKDIKEVEHWENEDGGKAMYRGEYGNQGGYGRQGYGEGYSEYGRRGNFREGGYGREEYGARRRDSRDRYMARGKYRGEEMIDEMYGNYEEYMEGKEEYNRGNYGAESATMESLKYMLESVVKFIEMLKQEATNQEEVKLIQHYTKKISEM